MNDQNKQKIFRKLVAAEGYLQLGMASHALNELDTIEDAGPFQPPYAFMRGEALRAQERYDDAIEELQLAAKLIPAPLNKQAWLSLSDCFRHRGEHDLADAMESFANAKTNPVINVNIQFNPPVDPSTGMPTNRNDRLDAIEGQLPNNFDDFNFEDEDEDEDFDLEDL